ncbi:MAG: M56 family metallopeptidase [Lachnospiraceae bacterium]|nr:M56 family metallopeptidase [Lachnospiraceae bacterium]
MKLISMSISAGSLILFILVLRMAAARFLPRRLFVFLWIIALLRLLVPISIPVTFGIGFSAAESDLSRLLTARTAQAVQEKEAAVPGPEGAEAGGATADSKIRADASRASEEEMVVGGWNRGSIRGAALLVWALGAAGLLIYFGMAFRKEYRILSQCLPLPDKEEKRFLAPIREEMTGKRFPNPLLWTSDRIASPLAFGVLHLKIIFPKRMAEEIEKSGAYGDFSCILLHEWIHIRGRDNLWKLLALLAACLHWFNPLAWVLYVFLGRDLELACDESVIRILGQEHKTAYAKKILFMAKWQSGRILSGSGFGKKAVRERIVMIMRYKKTGAAGIGGAILLVLLSMGVFTEKTEAVPWTYIEATEQETEGIPFYQFEEYVNNGLVYDRRNNRLLYEDQPVGYFRDQVCDTILYEGCLAAAEEKNAIGMIVSRDADGAFLQFRLVSMDAAVREAAEEKEGETGIRVYDMQTVLNQVQKGASPEEICRAVMEQEKDFPQYTMKAECDMRGRAAPGTLYVRIIAEAGWGDADEKKEQLLKIGNEVMSCCWELREICFVFDTCSNPECFPSEQRWSLCGLTGRTRGLPEGTSLVFR